MIPLNDMLKKNEKIKWKSEAKLAFENMKHAIAEAPVLISPNYIKPFYFYSFSFGHKCAVKLTQRGKNKEKNSIYFMIAPFKEAKLRYMDIEK